jgi:alkanesulfonate monooxygenase SsuD/methylene tetrahydromethanopterin reductase-like flavin-dependent oxidoreductase (luciferase family)
MVFCNGYRHPVLLGREAATLDLLTDGRFELGVGAGVSSSEFEQMGIPFASGGARVGHLEETIQVIKQLFTEETVHFTGKHYTITAHLLEQRDRYGFSYLQIQAAQMENFAPVVAQLAGK